MPSLASSRPTVGTIALGVAVVAAILLNILAQVVNGTGAAALDDLVWHVLDVSVGAAYAIAAWISRSLRATRRISWVLVFGSVAWTFGTIVYGIQPATSWWVPLAAFQMGMTFVVVVVAISYPDGHVTSLLGQVVVGTAGVLYVADILLHLFLYDPAVSFHCLCEPNPLAIISDRDLSNRVAHLTSVFNGVVGVGLSVAVVVRWLRATGPWRSINLLMTAAVLTLCGVWLFVGAQRASSFGLPTRGWSCSKTSRL